MENVLGTAGRPKVCAHWYNYDIRHCFSISLLSLHVFFNSQGYNYLGG